MTLAKFYCPVHGFLCETSPNALVLCGRTATEGARKRRCNKRATTIKPERKVAA